MKTISVIGCRKGQAGMVRALCGDDVKLKFVDADRLASGIPRSDEGFVCCKFVRHSWSNLAYKSFPRSRVHLHHGGITELARKIRGLQK